MNDLELLSIYLKPFWSQLVYLVHLFQWRCFFIPKHISKILFISSVSIENQDNSVSSDRKWTDRCRLRGTFELCKRIRTGPRQTSESNINAASKSSHQPFSAHIFLSVFLSPFFPVQAHVRIEWRRFVFRQSHETRRSRRPSAAIFVRFRRFRFPLPVYTLAERQEAHEANYVFKQSTQPCLVPVLSRLWGGPTPPQLAPDNRQPQR